MAKQAVKAATPQPVEPKGDAGSRISSFAVKAAMAKYESPVAKGKVVGGLAYWGTDNMFPAHNIRHFNESPTNASVISFTSDLIAGRELIIHGLQKGDRLFVGSSPKRFILGTALDYKLHGAFAWLVTWSRDFTKIASLQHVDASTVRKKMNEDGTLTGFTIANGWKSSGKQPEGKSYPVFDPIAVRDAWEAIKNTEGKTFKDNPEAVQLYWYEDYSPGSPTYPNPDYISADRPIEIEIQFFKFHLNGLARGYRPQLAYEIFGNYEEDDEKRIVKQIDNACDPEGSNVFVHFTKDGGDRTPTLKVNATDGHTHDGKYIETAADAKQAILTAHRLASPTLAGMPGRGKLGGDGLEIVKAFTLYANTVVYTSQVNILDALEEVFDLGNRNELTPSIMQIDPWKAFSQFAEITAPEQTAEGGDKTETTDTTTNTDNNGNA